MASNADVIISDTWYEAEEGGQLLNAAGFFLSAFCMPVRAHFA